MYFGDLKGFMTAHAAFSASGAHRWLNCAGTITLCKKIPRKTNFFAQEGTVGHSVFERCFGGDLLFPEELLGETIDGVEITQEMVDAVNLMIQVVDSFPPGKTECEVKLSLDLKVDKAAGDLFGTADILHVSQDSKRLLITVCDFKYGRHVPVDVEHNVQLIYYGLGAIFREMRSQKKKDLNKFVRGNNVHVRMMIVQPRAEHESGPVREWVALPEDLLAYAKAYTDAINFAVKNPEKYNVGEHCRFCDGKPICPEYNKDELEDLAEIDPKIISKSPDELTPEGLADALHQCDLLEGAIKRFRNYASALLEEGETVLPGWSLEPTRPTRRWKDESAVRQKLLDMGVTPDLFSSDVLRSPAQIRSVLETEQYDELSEFIESRSSGLKLSKTESDGLHLL